MNTLTTLYDKSLVNTANTPAIHTQDNPLGLPFDLSDLLGSESRLIAPAALVGLSAYDLDTAGEAPQGDLFSASEGDSGIAGKRHRHDLEVAIDELKARYGADVHKRADDLSRARQTPNLDFLGDEGERGEE